MREYVIMFNPRPEGNTILEAYDTAITVGFAHKPRGGSLRPVRTADDVQRVVDAGVQQPKTSQRRLSVRLDLSLSEINRVLRNRRFHPYRLLQRHEPHEEDTVCANFFSKLEDSLERLQKITFQVKGHVNGWNCRFYAQENPDFVADEPLSSPKVVAWCGVLEADLRPILFQGRPRYCDNGG